MPQHTFEDVDPSEGAYGIVVDLDQVASGAKASRPTFDAALAALRRGGDLVATNLDRLGRSTQNRLGLRRPAAPARAELVRG